MPTRFSKWHLSVLSSLLVVVAFSCAAFAQFEKGAVSGTVSDSTGAVVVGGQVAVTSTDTGAVRTATTDNTGGFTVTGLAPGSYEIKVSHTGFGDFKQRFTISPGVHTSLDAVLSPRGTETIVEVTGRAETQVDTQTSSINQVVDTTRVSQLPSLTRDPYDFVQTMGNVNQDSASGTGGSDQVVRGAGVSINGQRSSSTDALLDGGENVDLYTTKVGQSVPLDSVQEFSVTSSNFSAEYGRASGGVINVVTKSGSNQFHGSVYEFNRLSALTSNDYDSNAQGIPKANYTRNQFGYSIGGPIVKSKLFFFSNTEWTRVRSAANILNGVIDPQLAAAANSTVATYFKGYSLRPGLTVNQKFAAGANASVPLPDPTTQPSYYNYACVAGSNPCTPNGNPVFDIVSFKAPSDSGGGAPQNTYSMVQRVDYNLSSNTTMYGRYALFNNNEFAGFINNSPYAGFDTGQTQKNQNILYSLTHIWGPRVVTETKVNFNRLFLNQPLTSSQPIQPSLYFNVNFDPSVQGQPFCLPGYSCTTPGNAIPFGGPQNVWQFGQSVGISTGKHEFRFGGQYVYTMDNRTFGAYENAVQGLEPGGNGSLASGVENMLNGSAGWFQVVVDPQGHFPCIKDANGKTIHTPQCAVTLPTVQPSFTRNNRYNDLAFYGQDSWKIKTRLTLNLGLRWEYYGVQHNTNPKLDSNFVYGTGNNIFQKINTGRVFTEGATANSPASPVGGLWDKRYHNFGPRVGFAYDVFGDGKTSLRGGYGIAYERNFGNVTFNVIQNPPAQFNSVFQAGAQAFQTSSLGPFAGSGTLFLPNPSLRYVKQDLPTAYAESYNLSLQREVARNSLLALDYSGSHGVHLYSIENFNQRAWGNEYLGTDPVANNPIDRLNRQYGNMNTRGANGFSKYNALNTRFASSNLLSQGLDFTVNYTWSHTIDNLSSTFSETPQTENLGLLDPVQPSLDKGPADFDARHRIAISAVWNPPYAKSTHGFVKQVLDGWELAPIITARTGNSFTTFDCSANIGDTVCARYFVPSGATIPLSGNSNNAGKLGPNVYSYLSVPVSQTYFNPWLLNATGGVDPATGFLAGVADGELPLCNITTNGAGNPISTGANCKWPSNMTSRNMFRGPGAYFINLAIGKTFPISERFKLNFRSEFYNLLNHSNYYVQTGSTADASCLSSTLGPDPICGTGTPSPLTIIGKRGFNPAAGVPNERRFIQFALRLSF